MYVFFILILGTQGLTGFCHIPESKQQRKNLAVFSQITTYDFVDLLFILLLH